MCHKELGCWCPPTIIINTLFIYEVIKREVKRSPIYKFRCDEILLFIIKGESENFKRLKPKLRDLHYFFLL